MKGMKIGKFNLEVPIVQGGMGVGVSLGRLAGSVAKEGGVGTISYVGIGYRDPDFYKDIDEANKKAFVEELAKAREISQGRGMIAINIMQAITNFEEHVRFVANTGVDAIVVGAGLPLNLPSLVEGSDVLIAPIISSKRALDLICRTWTKKYNRLPDYVVVEGSKAGGHLGFKQAEIEEPRPLKEILEEVVAYRDEKGYTFPIIAGGGVISSSDVKEMLDSGASGVQLGTRFIATYESDVSDEFKNQIINATADDVRLIFSPVGMPARAVWTPLLDNVEKYGRIKPKRCVNCLVPCDPKTTKYCISEALINSAKGNMEEGLVFSGENVDQVNELKSVKEIIEDLTKELV